jgi:AcrR family transcriptional regulator
MRTERLDTHIRQEQITQAALALIAAKGVRGLSVAAVARRVGLVPSAIYRHFASKDEVLDATIEHLGHRLLGNLRSAAEETDDPIGRLHGAFVRHVRLIRENQAIPRIIFSEEVYSGHPARKARMREIMTRYIQGLATIVHEGQRAGRIARGLDPRTSAVLFLGLIQPAAILWHVTEGRFDLRRHAARSWDFYRRGIEAAGSPPATKGARRRRAGGAP